MSDTVQKWAGRELDKIRPDGGLTMEEATALIQVLAHRLCETIGEVRPPVDEYGTDYPRLPTMDWNRG